MQRFGIHVVANHFYQPVPDTSRLSDSLWIGPSLGEGIDFRQAEQLDLLTKVREFRAEYDLFPKSPSWDPFEFYLDNSMFVEVDAEVLYSLIRLNKPRTVIEVGGGFSTRISLQALELNREEAGGDFELVVIEPYPTEFHRSLLSSSKVQLLETPVQEVDGEIFESLVEGYVLFIDSSHILKIGSDVHYLFERVLPKIRPGVLVHFHDIFLPAEYPQHWVKEQLRFYNEQYLLHAFLAFNSAFRVRWASSFMHLNNPRELKNSFSSYDRSRCWPASFWIDRNPIAESPSTTTDD